MGCNFVNFCQLLSSDPYSLLELVLISRLYPLNNEYLQIEMCFYFPGKKLNALNLYTTGLQKYMNILKYITKKLALAAGF